MKVPLPAAYAGFEVRRDLASGEFAIATPSGARFRAHEWTWGERRRLLEGAKSRGDFDRQTFVEGLCELVLAPAPPPEERPALACLMLELFGVSERSPRRPLVRVEVELARRFGWTPQSLDGNAAPALDAVAALAGGDAATSDTEAWTSIEVEGDDGTGF